jgi:hypothetical protein
MEASQTKQINRADPVWVWDGGWWPATIVAHECSAGSLIVRLENGVTVPVPMARLRPRDPELRGADKPRRPCG